MLIRKAYMDRLAIELKTRVSILLESMKGTCDDKTNPPFREYDSFSFRMAKQDVKTIIDEILKVDQ